MAQEGHVGLDGGSLLHKTGPLSAANQYAYDQVYGEPYQQHQAKLSHELMGGAFLPPFPAVFLRLKFNVNWLVYMQEMRRCCSVCGYEGEGHPCLGTAPSKQEAGLAFVLQAYEDHCARNGRPGNHVLAKEVLAGLVGFEIGMSCHPFLEWLSCSHACQQELDRNPQQSKAYFTDRLAETKGMDMWSKHEARKHAGMATTSGTAKSICTLPG